MALIICVGLIPHVQAAQVQPAMWFMDNLNITQVPGGDHSHKGTQNFDVGHGGLVHANIKAPFDCKIVTIYTGSGCGNTVIIQSLEKVLYADGTVDYMSMAFGHDNDVSDLKAGQTLKQGQVFYQTGTKDATAAHAHVTCIKGKYKNDFWTANEYGNKSSPDAIDPTKALFIPEGITVIKTKGLSFVTYNPCSHTVNGKSAYVFQNDNSVVCSQCKTAYVVPAPTGGGEYLDIVEVNGTGTAPSHATPYGDATILTRYEDGDTVYVTGSAKNAYNNTWYKLSTGEWLSGEYLGTHSHCYNSKGFCDECLDGVTVVSMSNTKISLKGGKSSAPVHFAPYGASHKWTVKGSGVTVNGKAVNRHGNVWYRTTDGAWIFADYLNPPVSDGRVKVSDSLNLRAKANTNGAVLAEIPNNALVTVYTGETSGSWYSVYYNGKVGYVSKSYITLLDGYKAVAPPVFEETGVEATPTVPVPTPTPAPSPAPSTVSVSVLAPTDAAYTQKAAVSEHNATVVAHIKKTAGSQVTACGLWLYDANGKLIKEHREAVSNVGKNTTSFHSWYDINKEVGVTLDSGTTYQYRFFTVVNGSTYQGQMYSFTTKGTAPVQTPEPAPAVYRMTLDPNGGIATVTYKDITFNTVIGDLAEPTRRGYTFDGWYTAAEGGSRIYGTMKYNTDFNVTVYAHWKPNTYRMTLNPNGGIATVTYKDFVFDTVLGDLVEPTRKGYTFAGWYTAAEGGNQIYETMRCNVDFNVTVYAHWTQGEEVPVVNPFTDVPKGSYYHDAVVWAKQNNVTGGTSATTFSPDLLCTRSQVVTFLWSSQGKPEPVSKDNPFVDVKKSDWFYKPVLWAVEQGITSGTSATTFSPDVTCTSGQVLTFLWAANGKPTAVTSDTAWYAKAVAWADDSGLLGDMGRTFSAANPSPRSEIVTYLYRNAGSPRITVAD